MSWASNAIKKLKKGEAAVLKPRGHSMHPRVKDGQTVIIEPCKTEDLKVDQVVLVSVRGRTFLHLIKAIDGKRFLIGNQKGHVNGWVGHNRIHGRMKF